MDQFNIFLIGFMGTGKTTIANCLSRKLDRKVVEMDQIISERAGMSISDIFKTYGEQHFRDLEDRPSGGNAVRHACNRILRWRDSYAGM